MKHIQSYGIVCINPKNNKVLFIQKRNSYEFVDFIHGKYDINNHNELIKLFKGMKYNEKIIILSLNFDFMWYYVYLDINKFQHNKYYFNQIFNKYFNHNKYEKLIDLVKLNIFEHNKSIWEIPKGKKLNKNELDLDCAIREFIEESNIQRNNFTIILNDRLSYSFNDKNVNYTYHYYIAQINDNQQQYQQQTQQYQQQQQQQHKSNNLLSEVKNIKWLNIDDIKSLKNQKIYNLYKYVTYLFTAYCT